MKYITLSIPLLIITGNVFAQEDIPGSSDHQVISRFEGSQILRYSDKEFESFTYPLSSEMENFNTLAETKSEEGRLVSIEYITGQGVSATQVFRTYYKQLEDAGFKIIFSCQKKDCGSMPMHFTRNYLFNSSSKLGNVMTGQGGSYLVAQGVKDDQAYIVSLVVGEERQNLSRYRLDIVEIEELDVDKVNVESMESTLSKEGRFVLEGILFEFNKAELLPESNEALSLIAEFLKENPTKKIMIVGHTDNVGDHEFNLNLSEKRANAVVNELIESYSISNDRILAMGVGMASPVSTNETDEGRAKNRRVEIVLR